MFSEVHEEEANLFPSSALLQCQGKTRTGGHGWQMNIRLIAFLS